MSFLLNNPFVVVLVAVILIGLAGYYIRGFVDFLKGLIPVKVGWKGLVEKVNDMADTLDELRNEVAAMNRSRFAGSNSPTTLNSAGVKVAESINARKLAEKYAPKIQVEESDSAYSIQQKCFEFALEKLPALLTSDEVETIEKVAFEEGVDKSIIFDAVIGICLRDRIFEIRKISITEIDKD